MGKATAILQAARRRIWLQWTTRGNVCRSHGETFLETPTMLRDRYQVQLAVPRDTWPMRAPRWTQWLASFTSTAFAIGSVALSSARRWKPDSSSDPD